MTTILHYSINSRKNLYNSLKNFFGLGHQFNTFLQEKSGITTYAKAFKVPKFKIKYIEQMLKLLKMTRPINKRLQRKLAQRLLHYQENGSYRGLRMKQGLPCRGQRTKTNARTCKRFFTNKKKIQENSKKQTSSSLLKQKKTNEKIKKEKKVTIKRK